MKFVEYVMRRDEASFNPYNLSNPAKTWGGEAGQAVKTITGLPVGAGSALVGATAGMGAVAPEYRKRVTGNPFIDPAGVKTEAMAKNAFQKTSDWALDFIANQQMPKVKQFYMDNLRQVLEQILRYIQTHEKPEKPIAGVTMGKQAGMVSNIFALPMALVGGLRQAIKNAWDSFNPQYEIAQEWPINIQKMAYALDAMYMMLPNGDDIAENYIQELIHNLGQPAAVRRIGRQ
ncbi:hypothetical protein [Nitrospira sp. BLG_2]|uniref:hypothetical protein n=1 Tax=Nitrospira sp. BLG_2 TaxID=3397507 RepID=UPI003B99CAD1